MTNQQLDLNFRNDASNGNHLSNDSDIPLILSSWNGGFITEEAELNLGEMKTWDLKKHCNFYIWNFLITFLNGLKSKYEGDVNEITILIIYGLAKVAIEKELKAFGIDSSSIIPNFDELLFKNLSLALNGLSIYHQDEKTKELENNLNKFWNKSFKNIYDPEDNSIPFLDNKVAKKLSAFPKEKLKTKESLNKNDFISKLNKWSEDYEKISLEMGVFNLKDLKNLKEHIIEYDWDTNFLWLVSHAGLLAFENTEEIYSNSIVSAYGKLITNISFILEKLNIDYFEAINKIPNFFIRVYDNLILGLGSIFKHEDKDLNMNQMKILYTYLASDFLLKPTEENILNHDLFSVLGITFKCSYHENGLQKVNKGDFLGAIEDFTESIIANPNQQASYFDRALAKKLSKDYKSAIEDYSKVIELNKKKKGDESEWNATLYVERGFCRFLSEDDKGAIEDYTKAIEYNQESYIAYGRRGIVNDFIEKFEEAILDFTKALDLYSEDERYELKRINLHEKRAMSRYALDDFKGTKFDLNEVIIINNEKKLLDDIQLAELYEKLGCINTCLYEEDEALLSFSKAIDFNPKLLSAYNFRAKYLYQTFKDKDAALLDCSRALNLGIEEPGILDILYLRSNIKINSEIPQEAIEAIQDIDKMIKLHEKFFHKERSQHEELGEYYLLKAKAKYIINPNEITFRDELIQASKLGNSSAKEILEDLDQNHKND